VALVAATSHSKKRIRMARGEGPRCLLGNQDSKGQHSRGRKNTSSGEAHYLGKRGGPHVGGSKTKLALLEWGGEDRLPLERKRRR